MKALYIITWVCLVLSVIVHILSIFGPENTFTCIDGLVWMLHGTCILMFIPAILCVQKASIRAKEDSEKAVFKNRPSWTKIMVGFFVFYGIISFTFFTTKEAGGTGGHGTPPGIFREFSTMWMIFYSVEVAIFHSYLKGRFSGTSKTAVGEKILPIGIDSRQQYDLSREQLQAKRKKYSRIVKLLLIVGVVFSALLWLAFKGYPWFLGFAMASLFPFAVIHVIYGLHWNWRLSAYLQKNHFKIWKQSKSSSFAESIEAQSLIKELDDPYLKLLNDKAIRFSTICFWIWLVTLVLILTGLAIFVRPE